MTSYCVLKTADGRVLVLDPRTGFQASLINRKWTFRNMFGLADELFLVAEQAEADKFYQQARQAVAANPIGSDASDYYRVVYGTVGLNFSNLTYGMLNTVESAE